MEAKKLAAQSYLPGGNITMFKEVYALPRNDAQDSGLKYFTEMEK